MRLAIAGILGLLCLACSRPEEAACCAQPARPARAASEVDLMVAAACSAGLVSRGLQEEELFVIMHEPDGVCPNMGVSEARIREIIAKDWDAAGCTQYTKEQMLRALDTGRCGGEAG